MHPSDRGPGAWITSSPAKGAVPLAVLIATDHPPPNCGFVNRPADPGRGTADGRFGAVVVHGRDRQRPAAQAGRMSDLPLVVAIAARRLSRTDRLLTRARPTSNLSSVTRA